MPDPLNPALRPQVPYTYPFYGRDDRDGRHPYRAAAGLVAALNTALALERPLLLTGEPGCGKTDFAWAAADALATFTGNAQPEEVRHPLRCHVRSDTQAKDLLYHYDAVRRFGDAHHPGGQADPADPRRYVELRPLGRALMIPERRTVLIDEIDKAQRDLPNDLLWELDAGDFEIPEIPEGGLPGDVYSQGIALRRRMAPPNRPRPLVIVTSNTERQLPDAFLRRCIFWDLPFPDDQLEAILKDRFSKHLPPRALELIAAVFRRIRDAELTRRPGTAELVDWARTLAEVHEPRGVADRLDPFTRPSPPWRELPGLFCLVKQRDDLAALAGR